MKMVITVTKWNTVFIGGVKIGQGQIFQLVLA